MSDEVREILTAPEIVAIDQDAAGRQGQRVRRDGDIEVWTRSLGTTGDRAIATLNRGSAAQDVRVSLEELGVAPRMNVRVRDLWKRTDVGEAKREIVIPTSANTATVFRVTPQ
jgi:alpha-galactosidase